MACAAIALGSSTAAVAETVSKTAAFNISPLRLELASNEQSTKMLVRNESGRALAVQVRVFRWDQKEGKDVYSPSREIAVSPSIIKIAAERTQTFHLVAPRNTNLSAEKRYRVIVDQLPDRSEIAAGMARTRLRMTLPLFIGSQTISPANLTYGISNHGLVIKNTGGRTARLSSLAIKSGQDERKRLPTKGPKYVMGGSEILISLPSQLSCGDGNTVISGIIDKKKFDAVPAQNCS